MKKLLFFLLIVFCFDANSQLSVIAHYNFAHTGNISNTLATDEVNDIKSGIRLSPKGHPIFYADAPQYKLHDGNGSVLFNGQGDGYETNKISGNPEENMILEVWVKAGTLDHGDDHLGQIRPVVALGNIKEGYTIAQQGSQWVLVSGGQGIFSIGNVVKDLWVHLAAVKDGENCTLWMNGEKTGTFRSTKSFAKGFSVGMAEYGNGSFNGGIYEVRYCTFKQGRFNPGSHFILDSRKLKAFGERKLAERRELIKSFEAPGVGKKIVGSLSANLQMKDWLINKIEEPCNLFIEKSTNGLTSMIRLQNGLVSRTFYISENLACVNYNNLSNNAEYIRAIKPEARIKLDSVWYDIGGLVGSPEKAYLLEEWYSKLKSDPRAFVLKKIETGMPLERYPWKQKFNATKVDWPAKGLRLTMFYKAADGIREVQNIEVLINYEIYEGIPVIMKWFEINNYGDREPVLKDMECEVLAINQDQVKRIHLESDYSFALANWDILGSGLMHFKDVPKPYQAGQSTTKWMVDPDYNTWATHNAAEDIFLGFPHRNLLVSKLPMGPDVPLTRTEPFRSYNTFELLLDADDKERQSLSQRRMYRKLAPQVTESGLGASITAHDEKQLKLFIDQMHELGMERLYIDAWPGITYDNNDEAYLVHWREISDYANKHGIIMGGYELQVASRGRGKDVDCIDPVTGEPGSMFGQSVCIASDWRDRYYPKMWEFYERTGFMVYSADGPYHGDACASEIHKYHRGLKDSQWKQWKFQVDQIHEAQRRSMYVTLPDWYFLNGQGSTGMGYREASANLSPEQQLLLGRQYIYDGTWFKIPTMGYMTLQLVGFYSNDPRIGLEPLNQNIQKYEQQLIQYLASGCQLGIRGNRLFDTQETKAMVLKWLNWFREYREILTSEIIHVTRPTGRDLDCIMHVNPFIKHKAMVIVFNPTDKEIEKIIKLPMYYSGLKEKTSVSHEGEIPSQYDLNEEIELNLSLKLKPKGITWFILE